jgi:hypothetical protein
LCQGTRERSLQDFKQVNKLSTRDIGRGLEVRRSFDVCVERKKERKKEKKG